MSGSHGHDHSHHAHDHQRSTLTQRAALASVSMATFLLGLKIWAAWSTASVAMLGSLADTGLDIIASLVTLFSVRLAAQPADHEHRYGHGKAEALAALFQGGIITASAIAIAWRGISRIGDTEAPSNPELGIAVSVVAMALTLVLITYQRFVVKRTGSLAIQADHVHYSSDLLLNGSVIIALVLDSYLGIRQADPVFGVAIALWLLWQVREIAGHAVHQLMDREWRSLARTRCCATSTICGPGPAARGILRKSMSGSIPK
jgi:ferrous-iron efflux pump FieF